MSSAARRGLRLHEQGKSGDGLKPETVRRANIIEQGKELTESHVREMRAWFARHKSDKRPGWDDAGEETPGFTAWLLWGGDPAKAWSERKVEEMDREQQDRSHELRYIKHAVEVREHEGKPRLVGYAARFNEESHILAGNFREVLSPGAFTETLADETNDVLALYNHDTGALLGRESAGTLRLVEDNEGLMYSIDPPDTQLGRDTVELVRSGNLAGASFAFRSHEDDEEYHRDGEHAVRTIRRLTLYEISLVANPAYPTSTAAVRERAQRFIDETTEPTTEQEAHLGTVISPSPLAKAEQVARWIRREC
jgi:HK97 family phage prohead protease